jgi:ribonuclease HI
MDKVVVMYCDGSARPNPGPAGWGAHGYSYEADKTLEKDKSIKIMNWVIGNNGYSQNVDDTTPVTPLEFYDFCGPESLDSTNNRGELLALIRCLEHFKNRTDVTAIKFFLDSTYVIRGTLSFLPIWAENGWKTSAGTAPKNVDLWKRVLKLKEEIEGKRIIFSLTHVEGHNGNVGNERADRLALIGRNSCVNKSSIDEFKTYSLAEFRRVLKSSEQNPLLRFKRMFFAETPTDNMKDYYLMSNAESDKNEVGLSSVQRIYIAVKPKPEHESFAIKQLVKLYRENYSESYGVATSKVEQIFSKDILPFVETYGAAATILSDKGKSINSLNNEALVYKLSTPLMSIRAINNYNYLIELAESYERGDLKTTTDNSLVSGVNNAIDVTKHFYEVNSKGVKSLKKDLVVGASFVDIDVSVGGNECRLKALLGIDLPDRNTMKRLEVYDPKIYGVYKSNSDGLIHSFYIIDSEVGMAVSSSFYAIPVIRT